MIADMADFDKAVEMLEEKDHFLRSFKNVIGSIQDTCRGLAYLMLNHNEAYNKYERWYIFNNALAPLTDLALALAEVLDLDSYIELGEKYEIASTNRTSRSLINNQHSSSGRYLSITTTVSTMLGSEEDKKNDKKGG